MSDYYLVEEVASNARWTARGRLALPWVLATYSMAIALPAPLWTSFHQMNASEFAHTLKQWANQVHLKRFCSSPRGKKKPKPKPIYDPKHPHRSTARLLQQQKQYIRSP